jgi:predicted membrane-bound spermidine synthase
MGGTLPLLIKEFTPQGTSLKANTGWFYAINTLGAAFGCYLAGFHLLPSIGLYWSNISAVILNIFVGIGAIVLTRYFTMGTKQNISLQARGIEPVVDSPRVKIHSLKGLYFTVAVTGFASLVLQMVWIRQLSLVLGGSTYAFTAVLFVFIIGIGLGSLCFHVWLQKFSKLNYALVFVVLFIVISTVISYLLIPSLTFTVGMLIPLRSSQVLNALICVFASCVLEFLPAFGMGLLFPIFVHLTRLQSDNAGKAVGNIYARNTIGTITGSSITAALLIPILGVTGSIYCALILYILALNLLFPKAEMKTTISKIVFTVSGYVIIFMLIKPIDPRITNFGMYLYGYSPPNQLVSKKVLYFKEGPSCNVLVTESGSERSLRVNGKIDASSRGDMKMQLGLTYLPRFILPKAKNVLNIGFGSGVSAGASLLFPDTHVTCCEIEPAVFAASQYFHEINHKPELSPRFKIVFDDGRNHLQGTNEKYDMILSEPSNPWLAGVSNLFTKEFYEMAKSRLNNEGVLAQWLQMYSLSVSEYAMVVRTFISVFPNSALLRISDGDTILLGSDSSLDITKDAVWASQLLVNQQPEIKADLEKYFGTTDVASLLLQHLIMDEKGLKRLAAFNNSKSINTDMNMKLEYEAPLHLFADIGTDKHPHRTLLKTTDIQWYREVFHKLGCTAEQIDALYNVANLFLKNEQDQLAYQLTKFGMEIVPDEPRLFAIRQILEISTNDAGLLENNLTRIVSDSPEHANKMGVFLWEAKQYEEAITVFKTLSLSHPCSVTTWTNLAVNYEAFGDTEKAKEAYEKAISLDPFSNFTKSSYEDFKKKAGSNDKQEEQNITRPDEQVVMNY